MEPDNVSQMAKSNSNESFNIDEFKTKMAKSIKIGKNNIENFSFNIVKYGEPQKLINIKRANLASASKVTGYEQNFKVTTEDY